VSSTAAHEHEERAGPIARQPVLASLGRGVARNVHEGAPTVVDDLVQAAKPSGAGIGEPATVEVPAMYVGDRGVPTARVMDCEVVSIQAEAFHEPSKDGATGHLMKCGTTTGGDHPAFA